MSRNAPAFDAQVWICCGEAWLARERKAPMSGSRHLQTACRRPLSMTLHGHETALPRSWLSAAVIGFSHTWTGPHWRDGPSTKRRFDQ